MGELLRYPLAAEEDVAVARQLTCDVAREVGMASLEQAKLAAVVSGLARRCLAAAGAGDVVFSVDDSGLRLVVVVADAGLRAEIEVAAAAAPSSSRVALGLDLHSLRRLVDDFEQVANPNGNMSVTASVRLPAEVRDDPDLMRRLGALAPSTSPMPEYSASSPVDPAGMLEAQSKVLELTIAELAKSNAERSAVNEELALTNRGVLDLIAELSAANDSLTISGAESRQLADQQSALADLGHRAVASRDIRLLALGMVGIIRSVLGVQMIGVLRFKVGQPKLVVVAADGYEPHLPQTVKVGRRHSRDLRREGTQLADLTHDAHAFPLPAPPGSISGAVVAVHTPAGPWGVLVASASEPDRFSGTTTAFLEAAASLLAFSIARMALEEAAQHGALHDTLTGLPNRAQLLECLDRALDDPVALSRSSLSEPQTAVIFMDIDGFKQINDTRGHAAGDQVLIEAASRLRSRLRPTDVLARLGGDEFVVLCGGGIEAAEAIATRLLSAFDDPFVLTDGEVFLSTSAGLALAGHGVTAEQVLADADIAMYQAKQRRGSATVIFHPKMRALADAESQLHNQLRRAIEHGQLRAVYQPIIDLHTGMVCAVEALLRWRHPDLGDVSAQQTVAAAERIGLAWEFTCWIAAEAAGATNAWNVAHPEHEPLRLAVNFTPLLLADPHRVSEFEALVTGAGLPFDLLDVELTETAFADPTAETLASITELRQRGARLAMDDFGTGYSSLMAVATLPLDVLKIDRSFVAPLVIDGDSVLVSAMTGIARGRGLETIGEGIETTDQLAALISVGCDLGQGYLFAKPFERDELVSLISVEPTFGDLIRRTRLTLTGDGV